MCLSPAKSKGLRFDPVEVSMVINPLLFISSIKVRIIIILLIGIFFFSKSITYQEKENNPENRKVYMGILLQTEDLFTTRTFNPGPFMIRILKVLAFLSVLSIIVAMLSEFQTRKITFSL